MKKGKTLKLRPKKIDFDKLDTLIEEANELQRLEEAWLRLRYPASYCKK